MQTLLDWLKDALTWLYTFCDWCVNEVCQLVMAGGAAILTAIPVPSWLETAGAVIGGMDPGVAFVAGMFRLPEGVLILVSAFTIRFVIRRIPFFG